MAEPIIDRHRMSTEIYLPQPALPGMCSVTEAVHALAHLSEAEDRGAIFTRREVVDFVLDLVGYTPLKRLQEQTLLEPSFGNGEFLLAALERLLCAWKRATKGGRHPPLDDCLRGVELHHASCESTKAKVIELLKANGIDSPEAARLATPASAAATGQYIDLSALSSLDNFVRQFAAHISVEASRGTPPSSLFDLGRT